MAVVLVRFIAQYSMAVWLLVSGGMFLLIADIIGYQLAIY